MSRKYHGKPLGECPTIEPSDEAKVAIHAKEKRVAIATKKVCNAAVKRSYNRLWRERKRMKFTPCADCVISATCEKRRKHGLDGCNLAIVATPDGPKAACAASIRKGGAK